MSYSYSYTETSTFTVTHAKHIAAKVATDLMRMNRYYNEPSFSEISDYESEVVELLKAGYLGTITYGFQRNGDWIEPTLKYRASDFNTFAASNDDPGSIPASADVSGAQFGSYLTYSNKWDSLRDYEKEEFKKGLPIKRLYADEPGLKGNLEQDRTYSAGGVSVSRSSLRSF